jgi:hypothetical protein
MAFFGAAVKTKILIRAIQKRERCRPLVTFPQQLTTYCQRQIADGSAARSLIGSGNGRATYRRKSFIAWSSEHKFQCKLADSRRIRRRDLADESGRDRN